MASSGSFEEKKSSEDNPGTSTQFQASALPEEAVNSGDHTELEMDQNLVLASLPTVNLDNCLNDFIGDFLQKQVIKETMQNVVEFMCSEEAIPLLGNMKALFEETNCLDKPKEEGTSPDPDPFDERRSWHPEGILTDGQDDEESDVEEIGVK